MWPRPRKASASACGSARSPPRPTRTRRPSASRGWIYRPPSSPCRWGSRMAALDWAFACVLLVSLAIGAWRGLVYEVLSVLGWIVAFVLAQWFAPQVSLWLPVKG